MTAKNSRTWGHIVDWIVPRAEPLSAEKIAEIESRRKKEKEECDERIAAFPNDEKVIACYLADCSKLLDDEEARRLSVEGRLTSIVGLCSIAGTIVFGGIIALAARTLRIQAAWMRWVLAVGALYLAVQICTAILAAVGGLSRKGYLAATATDVLLATGETRPALLRRRINECLNMFWDHQDINNKKVTKMAVAHRAMENFLWGLLLIAVLGAGYGALARYEDPLVERVKKDRELQELLRGPQGPLGPQGPQGLPGPMYAPGVKPASPSSGEPNSGKR
jgi:hypothetical protein